MPDQGYHIERKTGSGGEWAEIAVDTASPYADSYELATGNTYYYRVRYYNAITATYSGYSNEVTVTYNLEYQQGVDANVDVTSSFVRKAKSIVSSITNAAVMFKRGITKAMGTSANASGTVAPHEILLAQEKFKEISAYVDVIPIFKRGILKTVSALVDIIGYMVGLKNVVSHEKAQALTANVEATVSFARSCKKKVTANVTTAVYIIRAVKRIVSALVSAYGYTSYPVGVWYIERKTGSGGTWEVLGTSVTSPYADSHSLVQGNIYYYRIRYFDGGFTAYSNTIAVPYTSAGATPQELIATVLVASRLFKGFSFIMSALSKVYPIKITVIPAGEGNSLGGAITPNAWEWLAGMDAPSIAEVTAGGTTTTSYGGIVRKVKKIVSHIASVVGNLATTPSTGGAHWTQPLTSTVLVAVSFVKQVNKVVNVSAEVTVTIARNIVKVVQSIVDTQPTITKAITKTVTSALVTVYGTVYATGMVFVIGTKNLCGEFVSAITIEGDFRDIEPMHGLFIGEITLKGDFNG
ncbi:MAG: hypothetical protein PHR07_04510 [Acidaminococcaceae bacterium]|nr:hypothetical protein [Acidaminococcaceae bacterium]